MRIKDILREKQLTQQDLSVLMGVSLSAVKQMLNASSLTTATLTKIATALDVPLWQLFASKEDVMNETTHGHAGFTCPKCGASFELKETD